MNEVNKTEYAGHKIRGGTQIWFGQGCVARASKPYPSLRVIFGRKEYTLLRIFLEKIGPFFTNLAIFAKTRKLGLSQKIEPMFKDFVVKKNVTRV